jgi:hypothetical protein
MRKNSTAVISLAVAALILCCAAPITSARAASGKQPPGKNRARPPAAPVVTEIVDLLDGKLFLDEETGETVWRSRVVDTSRFVRIGLRAYGDAQGLITCNVAWRFSEDDDFRQTVPWVWFGFTAYQGPDPRVEHSEVRGLSARVICELRRSALDPGSSLPASGTLTDVKVMLRR